MEVLEWQRRRPVLQTITNDVLLVDPHRESEAIKGCWTTPNRMSAVVATRKIPSSSLINSVSVEAGSCASTSAALFAGVDTEAAFRTVCLSRICGSYDDDPDDYGVEDHDTELRVWNINDFDYVHTLGQGGSATVYAARERQSGHMVALKVQEVGGDYDDGEAEALYEVDIHDTVNEHACIVRMHDYFFSEVPFGPEDQQSNDFEKGNEDDHEAATEDKRFLIIILQLCTGGSLFDMIRDSPSGCLSESQAAALIWDAIDALEYVHGQGIIHCDIKTLNFLVHNGTCMLADFGMGVHNDSRVIVGGSPMYMAPEHLKAWRYMTCNFDHKTDIYSLGVILYEILVGYLPYEVIQGSVGDNEDSDSVDSVYASLCAAVDNLDLYDSGNEKDALGAFRPPILDLRKLDDHSSEDSIYIPPPIFPEFVSSEAQDLITALMELSPEKRVSLADARQHPWFQKYL